MPIFCKGFWPREHETVFFTRERGGHKGARKGRRKGSQGLNLYMGLVLRGKGLGVRARVEVLGLVCQGYCARGVEG